MIINTRRFLRDFAACKARARRGETVHIQDREGGFLFTAATRRRSLLGAARGRVVLHGDLTEPTLPNQSWRPSL